ncbi:hypothetical protein JHK82_016909 [Glycine max]|nr:hypothetical protein JHK85_017327 [Glycine max]KAG5047550.1 hypothetical protein JHK86_016956 [Glycine max]KAG5150028.1 hypothetical protein JHK82_016909 [Glycine max]
MFPQPQFNNCHKEITKVGILITFLDDVYDIYGTLGELELFTNAVERWDVNSINTLLYCLDEIERDETSILSTHTNMEMDLDDKTIYQIKEQNRVIAIC